MRALTDYFAFARVHPEFFTNPSSSGFAILLTEHEIREVEEFMTRKLEARGLRTEWAKVGIVYEDQNGCMLRDAVRFANGELGTYIRFVVREGTKPAIAVLPLYRSKVLLVRRFHHTTRTWHLEVPNTLGMRGLSAEANAKRELEVEISAVISHLASLGKMRLGTGINSDWVEFFYAEVESYGCVNRNIGIAELLQVEVTEFEKLIRENQITESRTIVAYTRAKLQGLF